MTGGRGHLLPGPKITNNQSGINSLDQVWVPFENHAFSRLRRFSQAPTKEPGCRTPCSTTAQISEWGIGLTQVAPICSMRA
jgi:hypothetical protein